MNIFSPNIQAYDNPSNPNVGRNSANRSPIRTNPNTRPTTPRNRTSERHSGRDALSHHSAVPSHRNTPLAHTPRSRSGTSSPRAISARLDRRTPDSDSRPVSHSVSPQLSSLQISDLNDLKIISPGRIPPTGQGHSTVPHSEDRAEPRYTPIPIISSSPSASQPPPPAARKNSMILNSSSTSSYISPASPLKRASFPASSQNTRNSNRILFSSSSSPMIKPSDRDSLLPTQAVTGPAELAAKTNRPSKPPPPPPRRGNEILDHMNETIEC